MTDIEHRLNLPPDASSASAARRFVAGSIDVDEVDAELALLLVSELASNAILHAKTPFTVVVTRRDSCVRFAVIDESQVIPTVKPYANDAVTGRGLMMVASSSAAWGIDARPFGKAVWFELPTGASVPR